MAGILQEYIAKGTEKSSEDLVKSFLQLPDDKRNWQPDDKARSAVDQIVECAILNGYTAHLIETQQWPIDSFDVFFQEKARVAEQDWEAIHALLQANTQKAAAAIQATPDEMLSVEIQMPWSKQALSEILGYAQWNMTYHQGQINYIASMLGCLK